MLKMQGISKSFPGVKALDDVTIATAGENVPYDFGIGRQLFKNRKEILRTSGILYEPTSIEQIDLVFVQKTSVESGRTRRLKKHVIEDCRLRQYLGAQKTLTYIHDFT